MQKKRRNWKSIYFFETSILELFLTFCIGMQHTHPGNRVDILVATRSLLWAE